jgi:gamma-glutamylcyclotransferase (GGCT)/AIG2-like uncharacterized protein YtfP
MLPFFVYGTLLPEQPNFTLWDGAISRFEPAKLYAATLYDMGSFPMLVEEQCDGTVGFVRGCLVYIEPDVFKQTLQRLDELEQYDPQRPESSAYRRVQRTVITDQGFDVMAWVYIGNLQFSVGLPVISTGDWVSYSAEKMVKIHKWWQNFSNTPFFPAS